MLLFWMVLQIYGTGATPDSPLLLFVIAFIAASGARRWWP